MVADFEDDLARLRALDELLSTADGTASAEELAEVMGRIRLQASWSDGQVVVWAGGPGTTSTTNDDLADRLEAIGGPAVGWSLHPDVPLPAGARAEALSIPVGESLGWLVAVGGGSAGEDVGPSVTWLGRVAVLGVRLVAAGAVVPTLRTNRSAGRTGGRRRRRAGRRPWSTRRTSRRWPPPCPGRWWRSRRPPRGRRRPP